MVEDVFENRALLQVLFLFLHFDSTIPTKSINQKEVFMFKKAINIDTSGVLL